MSLAHSTQVSYGRHLKRVEKKLGALTVREIEASDVVALIEGAGLTWGESNMLLITTKCEVHACLRQAADQRQPQPRHHAFRAAGRTAAGSELSASA